MAMSAREKFMDKKIRVLEQRLVLVERFVEMRFCESFRDFSIRNNVPLSSSSNEDNLTTCDSGGTNNAGSSENSSLKENVHPFQVSIPSSLPQEDEEGEEQEQPDTSYRTRSGRLSKRLTATPNKPSVSTSLASTTSKASSTPIKLLKITLTRVDSNPNCNFQEKTGKPEDEEGHNISPIKVQHESDNDNESIVDDYFTFPAGEDDAGGLDGPLSTTREDYQDDSVDEGRNDEVEIDPGEDSDDWNPSAGENDEDFEEDDNQQSAFKRQKTTPARSKKPVIRRTKKKMYPGNLSLIAEGANIKAPNPDRLKECPICHTHWKVEVFDLHMKNRHMKERHLQCSFCDKRFFTKQILYKHERIHKVEKYGRKCRLCSKVFVESFKVLAHERICIRKHLEANKHVNPAIIENVRKRSKNKDLKWPESKKWIPKGMKQCGHCKELIAEDLLMGHLKEQHANWKCNFCGRAYVEKSGLVRHLSNAHGQNAITCEMCKTTFESRQDIRSHTSKCRREYKRQSKSASGKVENELITIEPEDVQEEAKSDGNEIVDLESPSEPTLLTNNQK